MLTIVGADDCCMLMMNPEKSKAQADNTLLGLEAHPLNYIAAIACRSVGCHRIAATTEAQALQLNCRHW
jgi:hypothetical protein